MKHLCGDPLAFAQDSHQQMTTADRAFPHALGFLAGHDEHPARAESENRRVWVPLAAPPHYHDAAAYALYCYSPRDQLCRGTFLTQASQERVLRVDVAAVEGT